MIEIKDIDRKIVSRYLGLKPDEVNDVMTGLIDEAEALVKKDSEVYYVCGIYDIERREDGIWLDEVGVLLKGADIAKHLEGCEKAVLLCATLSGHIDTRIRSLQITNMPLALVYDACASVAIDQACDSIQNYVRERLPEYVQTTRFSPGYGDLPISMQGELLEAVDAGKRCGVGLTEGGMLSPLKTITAIFGLKSLSALMEGEFSAFIPENGGCGDESVCSRCKAAAKCSMANKNVKDGLEE